MDAIATPEGVVRDRKVCCEGLLNKGLLSGFHLGGRVRGKRNTVSRGLGKISINEEALQFVISLGAYPHPSIFLTHFDASMKML